MGVEFFCDPGGSVKITMGSMVYVNFDIREVHRQFLTQVAKRRSVYGADDE